jgi:hypothetical protein
MPADRKAGAGGLVRFRGVTLGGVATASFVLCALSGALLAPAYDAEEAARSIAGWLLADPGAVFLRNVHYWTAQAFLVATGLHAWDHLRASTERRVAPGVWLRVTLSVPVVAFLMLSGFLLRGDSDAQQAHRILGEVLTQIPLVGPSLATLLLGTGDRLLVVYVQHAATATLLVWLVIVEHARRTWPRAGAVAAVALLSSAVSLVLSPGLHDGLDPLVKGPWYFLGLQEVLHWTPWPLVAVAAGVAGLALLWAVRHLPVPRAERLKGALLAAVGAYGLLSGVGLFLRGENWSWQPAWPDGPSDLRPGLIVPLGPRGPVEVPASLPVVLERPEGCLVCHGEVTGLGDAHRPESVGCAACHAGDPFTLDPRRAHAGMILVPGNLADAPRTCGLAGCHPAVVPRVERSIMTTFAGVIAVNRQVFGAAAEPTAPPPLLRDRGTHAGGARQQSSPPPHVRDLGHGAADGHLRQLCASCHLGQPKTRWGPIGQRSRGGGCNACHLVYDPAATADLARYQATLPGQRADVPRTHPALTVDADNPHCFGCHSRSGRISTSYEGWHELHTPPGTTELLAQGPGPARFRRLEDGRYFVRMPADVHHEGGLDCIDCHTAREVMGTGEVVARKSEQVSVACEDCHAPALAATSAAAVDPESRKVLAARKWTLAPGEGLGRTRTGDDLVNVVVGADGQGRMRLKRTGEPAELRAPLPVCTADAGHQRLSCVSCHSAWAPRCPSCHTRFDPAAEGYDHLLQGPVQGRWVETSGPFEATPPTLGVRTDRSDPGRVREVVDPFAPGMILEVDRNLERDRPGDPVFRRLYARTFAHTVRREVRSCESCHNDPVALGYGRGQLRYEVEAGAGRWRFTPEHAPLPADGLPADAWTGFLGAREGMVSTREDVRPFTVEEQRRVLRVGACLTCHAGDSAVMAQSLADFEALLARRSPECALPIWP